MVRGTIIASVITLLLTLGGAWFTQTIYQKASEKENVDVFHDSLVDKLTNDNLVQTLSSLNLREKLGHVEWNRSVLSLSLFVPENTGRPENWFEDVRALIDVSFHQLHNVNRLLIQIVEIRTNKKQLLVAVDIRKTDAWLHASLDELDKADPFHDELWRKRLRLSFTSAWEQRFGPVQVYSTQSTQP